MIVPNIDDIINKIQEDYLHRIEEENINYRIEIQRLKEVLEISEDIYKDFIDVQVENVTLSEENKELKEKLKISQILYKQQIESFIFSEDK